MSLTKLIKPLDKQIENSDAPLPKNMYNIWTIYGMRGSGKSTLLLNSLNHKEFYKNYFDCIYLISPTATRDKKFELLCKELKDDNRCFSKLDEETIKNIMEEIKAFNDGWNYKKKKRNPRSLIIFDDCLHELPKSTTKSVIHELITTNRHLKTSIFITSQKFKALNTLIRANADIISFFTSNNEGEKKAFCDEYGIHEELLNDICQKNNDFIHITFCSGKRIIFDKFDKVQ
jgi:Cdc6-like AAA superfamily ATPase